MNRPTGAFELEFYDDPETGHMPVLDWIKRELTPFQRRAIGTAMSEILQRYGIEVCRTKMASSLATVCSSSGCVTTPTRSSRSTQFAHQTTSPTKARSSSGCSVMRMAIA
jgi:hypothetical protein